MFSPPPPSSRCEPCSFPSVVHYSFDMAQQVHYPSDPLQPGPILIDEASDTGKGANTIVSMLHHFFKEHGLGETDVHLHADNCVGQNKNNTMLHYLIWRVMVGLHHRVNISFLIVGHTKFSPDWCFGLLKQRFRRTKVSTLSELEHVVNISAEANIAQLVGTQSGEMIVPIYNWTTMFAGKLKKLKNIKKYQHFTITSTAPGSVCVRYESDTDEECITLLNDHTWTPSPHNLPPIVVPPGLSLDRQWYLHNQIAPYCPEEVRDITCPQPHTPLSATSTPLPTTSTPLCPTTSSSSTTPATSKAGTCLQQMQHCWTQCSYLWEMNTMFFNFFYLYTPFTFIVPPPIPHMLLGHHAHA